jgi:hypothetical protein
MSLRQLVSARSVVVSVLNPHTLNVILAFTFSPSTVAIL